MKKLISIPLILLLVFSGVSVKFATHYCGGQVAATKVSLSGDLASCGMESQSNNSPSQESISRHCCEDVTSAYSIDNTYIITSFSVEKPCQQVVNIIPVILDLSLNHLEIPDISTKSSKPPGSYLINSTEQPVLCIFRI